MKKPRPGIAQCTVGPSRPGPLARLEQAANIKCQPCGARRQEPALLEEGERGFVQSQAISPMSQATTELSSGLAVVELRRARTRGIARSQSQRPGSSA